MSVKQPIGYIRVSNIPVHLACPSCRPKKGDVIRNYCNIAKLYGYNVFVIDLRNPTRSNGNDPPHLVNKYMDYYAESVLFVHKATAEKYAKIIYKTIILSGMDAAESLLTATILLVAEFCEPGKRHIVSVFKIIQELLKAILLKHHPEDYEKYFPSDIGDGGVVGMVESMSHKPATSEPVSNDGKKRSGGGQVEDPRFRSFDEKTTEKQLKQEVTDNE